MSRPSSGRSSRASSGRSSARVQYTPVQTETNLTVERPVSRQSNQSENPPIRTNPTPSAPTPSAPMPSAGNVPVNISYGVPNEFEDVIEMDNPFDLRENYIQPLSSAGRVPDQAVSLEHIVDDMMDDFREQLKNEIKIEWDRDTKILEEEHIKRLKELNEHHQNEQFQLYEKNVQLHEKITNLGSVFRVRSTGRHGTWTPDFRLENQGCGLSDEAIYRLQG